MASPIRQAEVARATGLSRTTVAYAMNPRLCQRLRPETRQRVLDTMKRLGYRPHRHAQMMRGVKSGVIGMIRFSNINQLGAQRAIHLADATYNAGYQMLASDVGWYPQGVSAAVTAMLDAHAEGVVLCSPAQSFPLDELKRLQRARIPLVTLDGRHLKGIPHIRPDIQHGMFDLTRHLLGLGYRRLTLLIMDPTTVTSEIRWPMLERSGGFQEALVANPQADGNIVMVEADKVRFDDPYRNGYVAMQELLSKSDRPEVVLCSNDDWALGGLTACLEAGLRVPQDIAITGFDDTVGSGYGMAPLTTVAQPIELLSKKTIEVLVRMIRGERPVDREEVIQLPCELVVRHSCGAKLSRIR